MGADFNQLYKKKRLTNILTYGHISATTSQINFKFSGVSFNICTIQKLIDIKIDFFNSHFDICMYRYKNRYFEIHK